MPLLRSAVRSNWRFTGLKIVSWTEVFGYRKLVPAAKGTSFSLKSMGWSSALRTEIRSLRQRAARNTPKARQGRAAALCSEALW